MSRRNRILQIAIGLVVAIVLPIVTLWLAAPLSQGCRSSWSPWNIFNSPNFCSFTLSPLVVGLTLPTFVLGIVGCIRKAWPFGLTVIVVGALAWLYLIQNLVLTFGLI